MQGGGKWGLWSVHHPLPLSLLPTQEDNSLHSFPAPVWDPSHERQSMNFSSRVLPSGRRSPKNAPSWALTMACNPSGINWRVPHRITGPAWNLLQQGLFTGCSFLQSTCTYSGTGSSMDCSMDTCSTKDLHRLQGTLCSCALGRSSPSSFTDLWFTHVLSLFSPGSAAQQFLPYLKYFHRGAPNVTDWLR